MKEYIEREKLPQEVSADGMSDTAVAFAAGYNTCLEHVKSIPAADVRPVRRGKWTRCKNWTRCVCSACSWEITFVTGNSYNFCPNCGADMREES